ncbi:hypothetical protein BGZ46_002339 [Entomortierella lignicola]|nr:hypothetical protein BGZ46_002339 [Entomortierella lignicola]
MIPKYKAVLSEDGSYEKQLERWDDLKKTFPTGYKTFIDYVEKTWFKSFSDPAFLRRWTLYHRQEYMDINTNNHVESWHKMLKWNYLVHERNVRPDYLIYILQNAVDVDFQMTYWKIKNKTRTPLLTVDDKFRRRNAQEFSFDLAKEKIAENLNEGYLLVKSFTKLDVRYTLSVDVEQGIILNCDCNDFIKRCRPCKHMFLIDRIYDRLRIEYPRRPEMPDFKEISAIGDREDMRNTDEIVDRDNLSESILGHFLLVQQALTAARYRMDKEEREIRTIELKNIKSASKAEFRRYLAKAVQNFESINDVYSLQHLKTLTAQAECLALNTQDFRTKKPGVL